MRGGPGDDILAGEAGDDRYAGGRGEDTASFSSSGAGVTVFIAEQFATGEGDDVLSDIENLVGSPRRDLLAGDISDNSIFGGPRNDEIRGAGGDDVLHGNRGADHLDGGPMFDRCNGGPGTDSANACEVLAGVP